MSWFSVHRPDQPDPHSKPAKPGDAFGIFVILAMVASHPHYGLRARVRCSLCGFERIDVLAQLRHHVPKTHRGCTGGL